MITDNDLKEEIKQIFFEVFQNMSEQEFSWEKKQKDYEKWDSFAQLNLITLSEAKFNITFSLDESIEIQSANELFERTRTHLT